MPAKRLEILAPHGEFDGRDEGGRGDVAEGVLRCFHHVGHDGDTAARPDIGLGATDGDMGQGGADGFREADGVFGDAGAQAAACAAHEEDGGDGGFTVFRHALGGGLERRGDRCRLGDEVLVEFEIGVLLARGGDHEELEARPGDLGIEGFEDGQRVFDIGAAPAVTGLGDLEIAAGRRTAAVDADACGWDVKEFARLVFEEDAGDVIVDDDDLVGMAEPLAGEHADGGGTAADAHKTLFLAIDDRGAARLDRDGGVVLADLHLDGFTVTELEECVAGHTAFGLGSAGQVFDAAEGQHLGAVFGCHDMADGFTGDAHDVAFLTDVAVGVDFHLHAAVGEDALGHDGDHVDAVDLLADDEGGGLVVGVGGARADGGDEGLSGMDDIAVPVGGVFAEEGHEFLVGGFQNGQRIEAYQFAAVVGVAVAGARAALGDVAEDGTGVAADLVLRRNAFFSHFSGP